ncbi:MAG: hypothetical protein ABIQ97_02465 [Lysobacteraceae bacterium]
MSTEISEKQLGLFVYADFQNRDSDGFVRLNTVGTIRDLSAKSVVLKEGRKLIVSDSELEADVLVRSPGFEGVWRGEIVGDIREIGELGEVFWRNRS